MLKAAVISMLFIVLSPLIAISQSSAPPEEMLPEVEFSLEGGFYEHDLEVRLVSPGATIYYTLTGTKPNRKSRKYRGAIKIDETTVIRGPRGPEGAVTHRTNRGPGFRR